jgi:putative Mn2+ efflux pump MntP
MFNGEKTNLFWLGLIILGFASLVVFTAIWQNIVSYLNYLSYSSQYPSSYSYYNVWSYVPIVVGGIIFMLIGLYMMKSGVKKEQASQSQSKPS